MKKLLIFPIGYHFGGILKEEIRNPDDIGRIVRKKRKRDGLTLADTAVLCGVGYRFMSDLENGKKTAALGKVLQVIQCLGLEVEISSREWADG